MNSKGSNNQNRVALKYRYYSGVVRYSTFVKEGIVLSLDWLKEMEPHSEFAVVITVVLRIVRRY